MQIVNIHNKGRTVYLFKRDEEGNLTIDMDEGFFPYYYEVGDGTYQGYDGRQLKKLFVTNPSDVKKMRSSTAYEADIIFTRRYMIDKVKELSKGSLKYAFIDIEILTDRFPDPATARCPVSVISVYNSFTKEVTTFSLRDYETEWKMLDAFINYMKVEKFDLWLSWNVRFDYDYLYNRVPDFAKRISPINQERWGHDDINYPAGTSIVDYMAWFKKTTLNKLPSYALDAVAEEILGHGKLHKKVDFSVLSDEIIERNREDVLLMQELEDKKKIIPYFDEIRRMSKVEWEDLMWNCLDDKSEILTKKGWKTYKTITKDDTVLSYNLFSKKYEYVPIIEKYVDDYEGIMVYYDSPRVNFMVTSNHRFPMITRRNGGRYDHYEDIVFEKAGNIPSQRRKFILGGLGYHGGTNDYFSDEEIKLCAWIITEGHFDKKRKRDFGGSIIIYQTMINLDKREEIKKLLMKCNINYIEKKNGFVIPSAFATKYRVLLKESKRIPEEFFELPNYQMKMFLETCIKGDGHRQEGHSNGYISTSDKILAEQYQRLAVLSGMNCYINSRTKNEVLSKKLKSEKITYYCNLLFEKLDLEYKQNRKQMVNYKGKIWCIQTKNENFVMKRNNKVFVSGNSRIIDMLVLQEAKEQKVVLPMKSKDNADSSFEGAYRDAFETGAFYNIGKYDLSGAYMYAIIDLCLDSANIRNTHEDNTVPVSVTDRLTKEIINTYYIKQEKSLLPSVVKKLVESKNELKRVKNETSPDDPNYYDIEKKYESFKTVVLSAWGVIGNKYFRMFDERVAGMITSVVRDLLHYTFDELKKRGYRCIYLDTDSVFIDDKGQNITEELNSIVEEWALGRFGKKVSIQFDYEGHFEKLLILARCRYIGYVRTNLGLKEEIKGVEAKRKDSTVFIKEFQKTLINKILDKESKEDVIKWIKGEVDRIETLPLRDIAFPCKLSKPETEYKTTPIFVRAVKETEGFDPKIGDNFFYIYVEPEMYTVEKEVTEMYRRVPGKREGTTKKEKVTQKALLEYGGKIPEDVIVETKVKEVKKYRDVNAFNEFTEDNVRQIDWKKMKDRNIYMKLETIFNAMGWDIKEVQ